MSTRRAVVMKSPGVAEVSNVPFPKLRDNYIIVKTKAVALNPTDWKSIDHRTNPGGLSGCDYAGVVEEVGSAITANYKPGDRVAGFAHGANARNKEDGAFADYITVKDGTNTKFGENISFEAAATLGVGIMTVGQGLYQSLGLPLPPAKVSEPASILIYGASTATGTLAVQFAKYSGLEVITTSSPHNFDLLKSLGADQVFDYKDPDVGAKIRAATNDNLRLVFDCISEHSSPAISAAAISSKGGHYSSLLKVGELPGRSDVKVSLTMAYTSLGEYFSDMFPESQEDYEFGKKWWKIAGGLLNDGTIKPHPAEVREGGLQGIIQGLKDLKEGKVSGAKLVYKID